MLWMKSGWRTPIENSRKKISVHHCEGRDEDGKLILRVMDANVKKERTFFESSRIFVWDYDDESDVRLDESDEDDGNAD